MAFKTRQIRKKPPIKPFKKLKSFGGFIVKTSAKSTPKQRSYIMGAILIVLSVFIVGKVMASAYNFIKGFDPKDMVFALGSELLQDENGYTNIVLLGDGGHVRDGADLIDTIIVASIDFKKNAVTLLSIPRDYYIKDATWPGKINELYRNHKFTYDNDEEKLYGLFQEVAGEIANLDIHYYARVNFNAFVEIVDSLGGITVEVENSIYDPFYPNETDNGYTVFSVDKGIQEMDGETALKFVRSRKTTSDFDRAFRQQQVIESMREKALSKDILTNPKALKSIFDAVSSNTNTNLSIREIIALGGFANHFDRSHLISKVLHDDPGQDGGFLYTPERELYDGLFVLVPFGNNLDLIHKYADYIFNYREAFWNPPKIEVLNATKYSGIARNVAYQMNRFGFNISNIDNYYDKNGDKKYLDKSIILYYDWEEDKDLNVKPLYQPTLNALSTFVKASAMPESRTSFTPDVDISIVLGDDYDVFNVN
ncbi:LCP family protein [Candidatus Peregrinibacteria bacterium]|nr:LCP family protein [Candidatus Peregrinibacteria bacterium]